MHCQGVKKGRIYELLPLPTSLEGHSMRSWADVKMTASACIVTGTLYILQTDKASSRSFELYAKMTRLKGDG